MLDLDKLLQELDHAGASDLHLRAGQSPRWRVHGELKTVPNGEPVLRPELEHLLSETLTPAQYARFTADGEVDVACADPRGMRLRCNFFRDAAGPAVAMRRILSRVPTLAELELPADLEHFAHLRGGLVLVTGATGSGKSSTLAALLDIVNKNYARHVVTLEDPIEFLHQSERALVQQRALHDDVPDFSSGVRDALRGDVDVLLVGELRDVATTRAALSASETGMLVYATLHTNDAAQSIDRVVDIFPVDEQPQVRAMLGECLAGIVSQALLKRRDRPGRVPATEMLVCTPAVSSLIREAKGHEIPNVIQGGRNRGMHRFDDSLERLLRDAKIDREEALAAAHHRARFERGMTGRREPAVL